MLAGRFAEADGLCLEAAAMGGRAGDRNAELFAAMVGFTANLMRGDFLASDLDFALDKIASSPAGPAYRPSVAWLLAELGRHDEAHEQLARCLAPGGLAFDANWMSAIGECAERGVRARRPRARRGDLRPARPYAGRPITAGRAVTSATASPTATSASSPRCSAGTRMPSAICARRSRSTRRWAPPSGPFTAARRCCACATTRSVSRRRVHRDVRRAEPRERLPSPPSPPVLEPQSRQTRHEVELGGPRVAHLGGARLDRTVDEVVVLAAQALRDDVVDVGRDPARARPARAGRSGPAAAAGAPARAPR